MESTDGQKRAKVSVFYFVYITFVLRSYLCSKGEGMLRNIFIFFYPDKTFCATSQNVFPTSSTKHFSISLETVCVTNIVKNNKKKKQKLKILKNYIKRKQLYTFGKFLKCSDGVIYKWNLDGMVIQLKSTGLEVWNRLKAKCNIETEI